MPERIALVTGGLGGVGQSTVARLSREGWRVVVTTRGQQDTLPGRDTTDADKIVIADVSTPEGALLAVQECSRYYGQPPGGLVNCAGSVVVSPLHHTSESTYRQCLQANLDTAFFSLQAFTSACMEANVPGAAVLVSSVAARIGIVNHEAIAAAKAALEGLTRSAAATYSRKRIRINAVAPGMMRTSATESFFKMPDADRHLSAQYPLGRTGDVADVAHAASWLLSDEASWITGQVLPVDGGFTAVRPIQKST
ncbi:MAG: SDR family oxidoreductase [Halobacteria archaeon]|nr:SDR family oxidoreductase [Halobacteria archaeon]